MSEENQADVHIGVHQIYLKDCSFEAPNTPEVFFDQGEHNFDIKHEISSREVQDKLHEVVLTITLTGRVGDKTAWIVEVHQAGIFEIEGVSDEEKAQVLKVFCPTQLFPYLRECVTTLTAKSGFPPMVLPFISFDQLENQAPQ